jgi:hypothetical protein
VLEVRPLTGHVVDQQYATHVLPLTPHALALGVRASRVESAYFVVARRRKACLLALYPFLAPLAEAGAREPLPSSLASLARPGQRRASMAQHGGARFPTLTPRDQLSTLDHLWN